MVHYLHTYNIYNISWNIPVIIYRRNFHIAKFQVLHFNGHEHARVQRLVSLQQCVDTVRASIEGPERNKMWVKYGEGKSFISRKSSGRWNIIIWPETFGWNMVKYEYDGLADRFLMKTSVVRRGNSISIQSLLDWWHVTDHTTHDSQHDPHRIDGSFPSFPYGWPTISS